jgi:hypothetical protein
MARCRRLRPNRIGRRRGADTAAEPVPSSIETSADVLPARPQGSDHSRADAQDQAQEGRHPGDHLDVDELTGNSQDRTETCLDRRESDQTDARNDILGCVARSDPGAERFLAGDAIPRGVSAIRGLGAAGLPTGARMGGAGHRAGPRPCADAGGASGPGPAARGRPGIPPTGRDASRGSPPAAFKPPVGRRSLGSRPTGPNPTPTSLAGTPSIAATAGIAITAWIRHSRDPGAGIV